MPRRRRRAGEEPQRALGVPVDWIAEVDVEFFRSFLHPVKAYRRWDRRRRLGPTRWTTRTSGAADGPGSGQLVLGGCDLELVHLGLSHPGLRGHVNRPAKT